MNPLVCLRDPTEALDPEWKLESTGAHSTGAGSGKTT